MSCFVWPTVLNPNIYFFAILHDKENKQILIFKGLKPGIFFIIFALNKIVIQLSRQLPINFLSIN